MVFTQTEDFGKAAVEAQSFGLPVIAYKSGGALDIVQEGLTGTFFHSQTKGSLKKAIDRFGEMKFDKGRIIRESERFSKERFVNSFMKILNI